MNIVGKEDIKDILRTPLFVMWRGSANPENHNHNKACVDMVNCRNAEDLFRLVNEHGDPYQAEFSVAPELSYRYRPFKDFSSIESYRVFKEVCDSVGEIAQGKPMTKERY